VSNVSKTRSTVITIAAIIFMAAMVAVTQYLVSGRVTSGVMLGVALPTGIIFGQSLAKK
jgi:hypothetical protein